MVLDVGVRRHEVRDEADDELALRRGRHTASFHGATLSTVKDALKARKRTCNATTHKGSSIYDVRSPFSLSAFSRNLPFLTLVLCSLFQDPCPPSYSDIINGSSRRQLLLQVTPCMYYRIVVMSYTEIPELPTWSGKKSTEGSPSMMVSCLGESVGSVDEGLVALGVEVGGVPEDDVGLYPGSCDRRYLGNRTPLWTQAKTVLR